MTIDAVRAFCRTLEGTTEDIKWGADLVFSVGKKMYAVVCVDPPHTLAFKCTPEEFAELVERDGIIPAPYLARAMWVREERMGETLDRREIERLIATSYELVVAKLPKRVRLKPGTGVRVPLKPGAAADKRRRKRQSSGTPTAKRARRRRR